MLLTLQGSDASIAAAVINAQTALLTRINPIYEAIAVCGELCSSCCSKSFSLVCYSVFQEPVTSYYQKAQSSRSRNSQQHASCAHFADVRPICPKGPGFWKSHPEVWNSDASDDDYSERPGFPSGDILLPPYSKDEMNILCEYLSQDCLVRRRRIRIDLQAISTGSIY